MQQRTARLATTLLTVLLAACTGAGEKGSGVQPGGGGGGGTAESGSGQGDEDGDGPGSSSGDGGASVSVGSDTTTGSATAGVTVGATTTGAGGEDQVAEVYAQSAGTLYRIDLASGNVQTIGGFEGCGGDVIDIALDKNSQMFGTTSGALYRIDRNTAVCTFIASNSFPNSLSFVPAGTLDPTEEQLVGYFGADYVRIDTTTGEVDTIQSDALPGDMVSSGDIVSVIDGPTLLTVTGSDCFSGDCVIEIDPVTGGSIANHGSSTYQSVFGVAFWDGDLYGFTSFGEAFKLVPNGSGGFDAEAIQVGGDISFYGAGSTTAAPPGVIN